MYMYINKCIWKYILRKSKQWCVCTYVYKCSEFYADQEFEVMHTYPGNIDF